jgi:hypothetical protein
MTEINVMIERNVRFGFKYRSARKRLKGSFNSSLAWRQTQRDSNATVSPGNIRVNISCSRKQHGRSERFRVMKTSRILFAGILLTPTVIQFIANSESPVIFLI